MVIATLKKECDNCISWGPQTMGKCDKINSVTMSGSMCAKWNLPKMERAFGKYKALTAAFKNGQVFVYMAHWSGHGVTLMEAMKNLESKI